MIIIIDQKKNRRCNYHGRIELRFNKYILKKDKKKSYNTRS